MSDKMHTKDFLAQELRKDFGCDTSMGSSMLPLKSPKSGQNQRMVKQLSSN